MRTLTSRGQALLQLRPVGRADDAAGVRGDEPRRVRRLVIRHLLGRALRRDPGPIGLDLGGHPGRVPAQHVR